MAVERRRSGEEKMTILDCMRGGRDVKKSSHCYSIAAAATSRGLLGGAMIFLRGYLQSAATTLADLARMLTGRTDRDKGRCRLKRHADSPLPIHQLHVNAEALGPLKNGSLTLATSLTARHPDFTSQAPSGLAFTNQIYSHVCDESTVSPGHNGFNTIAYKQSASPGSKHLSPSSSPQYCRSLGRRRRVSCHHKPQGRNASTG